LKARVSRAFGQKSKALLLSIESVDAGHPAAAATARVDSAAVQNPLLMMQPVQAAAAMPEPEKTKPGVDADYLAKLAHELKTPLAAIAAASEIMRDERLGKMHNARYLSYASDIHESAAHALDLITALLAERGRPAEPGLKLIALNLHAIVERTVSSMQALAQTCGLDLSYACEGPAPHVVANPTAVRQVLLNLLTNAIKFTPRGGAVGVSTGHVADGRVLLLVRDTGPGMKNCNVPCEARLGGIDNSWMRGYGIGLPLVEALVRDMGADIQIESSPKSGTAVSILFSDFTRRFK
jgi:two-component system cell cycle sensor histidine kinase PleC